MSIFEYSTANRVLFGAGRLKEVGSAAASMGKRAFLLHDPNALPSNLHNLLKNEGIKVIMHPVCGEPTVTTVLSATTAARAAGIDLVIGVGGGSVLDTAKATAALLTNAGDIYDYLEVIGRGKPLQQQSAPCIAIPTTAGTGSEVTRNAVIAATEQKVKVSLRSPYLLPRLAVVDPELTISLPPDITAATGLDALTQLIEPFTCNATNPLTDALCREGMHRARLSLLRACKNGNDTEAREDMCLTSLFSGMALANSRLGAVHGFAAVIGGMFPAPHGAVCARLLPFVMKTNLHALQSRRPDDPILRRYAEIAQILTGKRQAKAEEGIERVEHMIHILSIPPLSNYGVNASVFQKIVAGAKRGGSMKGNPVGLTEEELIDILERASW